MTASVEKEHEFLAAEVPGKRTVAGSKRMWLRTASHGCGATRGPKKAFKHVGAPGDGMQATPINRIVEESSRKLLQIASPSVRYWVLTDIIRKDREDREVQRTFDECRAYRPMLRLIETIRPDGTWPIPANLRNLAAAGLHPPSYYEHMTILKNLLSLLHYNCDHTDRRIHAVLDRLMSWQTEEGYVRGPLGHSFPQPHYNGYALCDLCGFDREYDHDVNRVAEWLYSTQRADGGWIMPYVQDVMSLPQYRHMSVEEFIQMKMESGTDVPTPDDLGDVPSCHWTTMMVLWGLMEQRWLRKDPRVRKATSFLVGRFFRKNPHANFYESERNWRTIRYPPNKCGGLVALYVLTKIGVGPEDPRMEVPIEWLISARYRDGFWTDSNRPHTEAGQWLTLMALLTLDRYSKKL
jgi:hypothetical protein